MKRTWIFNTIAAVVVLMSILPASSSDGSPVNAGELLSLAASQGEISDNNDDSDFACDLLRTIIGQKGGNGSIVVSPISVSYLLGMLNEGADGETRRQITDVLGLGGSVKEINEYFKKMKNEASNADPTVTVKTANCIFFKSKEKLFPHYRADMQKYYDAWIEAININPNNIVNTINNWSKKHTDGMIPELLKKEELNPRAVMYLLNAVYFKANWSMKFDPQETRDMAFMKQDGKTVKHKMMHLETRAAYGQNDLCEMLCLPYGKGDYSMYVLLPREGKTIGDVIQSLSAQNLEKQRKQEMTSCKVDILLPRFTTQSETHLERILSSMGMPKAFGMGAEFPNMLQGHSDDLFVSMMKQKAKIEVNEEGTKAAAVTVAEVAEKGIDFIETFHALHPFVYYIVENSAGTILFMGTYCGEEGVALAPGEVVPSASNVTRTRPIGRLDVTRPISNVTNDRPSEEIFKSVEQMPQFPGGDAALMKFIDSHINYPPGAKIQGRVILQFVVKKDGSIGEVKVVRSVDKDLDKEAVRVIKSLPKFNPGRQNGQAVNVWYTLPVPCGTPCPSRLSCLKKTIKKQAIRPQVIIHLRYGT